MGTTHNGNTKHIQSLLGESDTNWIEIDFSSWEGESSESQFFDQIKQQILEHWEELPPVFVSSSETSLGKEEILDYIGEILKQAKG